MGHMTFPFDLDNKVWIDSDPSIVATVVGVAYAYLALSGESCQSSSTLNTKSSPRK
jgi:hypothetical protein